VVFGPSDWGKFPENMRPSPFRLASILVGTVFGLWVAFASLGVPRLIQIAYDGSLPILNHVLVRHRIEGGIVHPLEMYLYDWGSTAREITLSFLLFGLLGLVIVKALETQTFFQKFVGGARPGALGAIRMWTCGILLVSTCCERLDTIALLPGELRRPLGLMMLLDILPTGFDRFVASGPSLWAFQSITEILLFLGMIGCWTRIAVPLAVLCAYVLNGILREFSFFWHQNLMPIYVLAVLSFTPCGDGWSIDRLRRIYKGRPVPDAERAVPIYGWSRYACWVPMALLYCWSGLSKLRQSGLMWAGPTNMRSVMYEESLSGKWYPLGQGLHLAWAPDVAFVLLGLVAISGELSYPAILFSRKARRIIPLLTMGMHIGIIFLQDIVFLDLIALNLIVMDFSWLRDSLARRFARRGRIQIIYDGSCKYCRGTIRVLQAMDLFRRLEVIDFRRFDLFRVFRVSGSEYGHSRVVDLRTSFSHPGDLARWRLGVPAGGAQTLRARTVQRGLRHGSSDCACLHRLRDQRSTAIRRCLWRVWPGTRHDDGVFLQIRILSFHRHAVVHRPQHFGGHVLPGDW
jgi:hypothetical protein